MCSSLSAGGFFRLLQFKINLSLRRLNFVFFDPLSTHQLMTRTAIMFFLAEETCAINSQMNGIASNKCPECT